MEKLHIEELRKLNPSASIGTVDKSRRMKWRGT